MDKTTRQHKKLIKRRKPNRSVWGDILLYFFLLLVAMVMVFPIVYAVSSALKPLDDLCNIKFRRQFSKIRISIH